MASNMGEPPETMATPCGAPAAFMHVPMLSINTTPAPFTVNFVAAPAH
jgi:hypothetical protein